MRITCLQLLYARWSNVIEVFWTLIGYKYFIHAFAISSDRGELTDAVTGSGQTWTIGAGSSENGYLQLCAVFVLSAKILFGGILDFE